MAMDKNCAASRFLESVEINIVDMKCDPSNGFAYIGHAEDQHTKFGVLFPLKDDSPKEMAQCLKKYFISYFGPPVSFVSDCPQSFLPDVLCEVLECWKGDGLSFTLSDNREIKSERCQLKKSEIVAKFVRDNISMMAAECSDDSSWSEWLPEIMLRLNVARHTSLHLNPYSAVFGQKTSALLLAEQEDLRLDGDGNDTGIENSSDENLKESDVSHDHDVQARKSSQQKHEKFKGPEKRGRSDVTVANLDGRSENHISPTVGDLDAVLVKEPCDPVSEGLETSSSKTKNKRITTNEDGDKPNSVSLKRKKAETLKHSAGKKSVSEINPVHNVNVTKANKNIRIKQEPESDGAEMIESKTNNARSDFIVHPSLQGDTNEAFECRTSGSGVNHNSYTSTMHRNAKTLSKLQQESYGQSNETSVSVSAAEMAGSEADSMQPNHPKLTSGKQMLSEDNNEEDLDSMDESMYVQPSVEIDFAEDSSGCENNSGANGPGYFIDGDRSTGSFQFSEIKRKLSLEDHSFIERIRSENPAITLSGIKEKLLHERNVQVHISTISRAIKRMNTFMVVEKDRLDSHGSNMASFEEKQTEGMKLPVIPSLDQNEQDLTSFSQIDEAEEEYDPEPRPDSDSAPPPDLDPDHTQKTRMRFLPQDEVILKSLLNIKPLLTVDEIRERLEIEIGLVVTAYNLSKKISAMNERRAIRGKQKKQKHGSIKLPISDVSTSELGRLVNRNLQSKRRSYFVKGSGTVSGHSHTFARDGEYVSSSGSPEQSDGTESDSYQRFHVRRNAASTSVGENTMYTEDSNDDLPEVHFGEMHHQDFGESDALQNTETSLKPTKRSFQDSIVIDLSESPPPLGHEDVLSPKRQRQLYSRKPQECNFIIETDSLNNSGHLQKADLDFLKKLKQENPLITLNELKSRLRIERNLDVHIRSVSRAMKKIFMEQESTAENMEDIESAGANSIPFSDEVTGNLNEMYGNDSSVDGNLECQYSNQDDDAQTIYSSSCGGGELRHKNTVPESFASSSVSPREGDQPGSIEDDPSGNCSNMHEYSFENREKELTSNKKLTFRDLQFIQELKQYNPNLTLREMKAIMITELQRDVHLSTISRALKKMNTIKMRKAAGKMASNVIDLT